MPEGWLCPADPGILPDLIFAEVGQALSECNKLEHFLHPRRPRFFSIFEVGPWTFVMPCARS